MKTLTISKCVPAARPLWAGIMAFALLIAASGQLAGDPWGFFLTWEKDPTTTMTVQWFEPGEPIPLVEGQSDSQPPFDVPMANNWPEVWDRGLPIAFLGDENNQFPPEEDLSAEGRLAWNRDGLLIALLVRDSTQYEFPELPMIWAGDSIEVFISDGHGSNNRIHAMLSPGMDPNLPTPRQHFLRNGESAPLEEISVRSITEARDDGYRISILLPWENLPTVTAEPGADLGLQIYVNHRSEPPEAGVREGRQRIIWYPMAESHRNPAAVHAIRLAEETKMASQARLVYDLESQVLEILAPSSFVGEAITLRSGEQELGVVQPADAGTHASVEFPLPAAPEGTQWGAITAYSAEGTRIGGLGLPLRFTPPSPSEITYWEADEGEESAQALATNRITMTEWPAQIIQRITLEDLRPDTAYRFRAGRNGKEYGFHTMPAQLDRPLRLAIGGDNRHQQEWMENTNRAAMAYQPDLIVWGGDMAYADGQVGNLYRWEEWFQVNDRTLIDDEGYIVPIVLGIGNHELRGGYYFNHQNYAPTDEWRIDVAPFFYQFFAFPGHPGYGTLDFGDYLSLIILDSDHTNPVEGEQTAWLEKQLSERSQVPHLIPVYHVPAYPSHRPFDGAVSTRVRENWVPLFEQYGVQVAFENHDHTYKRTVPIRENQPHPQGIVYFGDGAWGVGVRTTHDPAETWYLERAESERHAIIMTLDKTHRHFLVVSEDGEILDELPATPRKP